MNNAPLQESQNALSPSHPIPSRNALDYLEREFGVFFHFGIRTFNEHSRDWDHIPMAADTFNPDALDCNQWIQSIRSAGATYAVLTAKHHDGFCNWPSRYTDYSVKNTPWKNGQGDVVREFVDACRTHGIKVGLYYSCAQFSTKDMTSKDYNDYVYGQLEELYGGTYGEIDEIWFDACGSDAFDFDEKRMENLLRKLQPNALVFGSWGNDIQWVGNEWGAAHMDNSNVIVHRGVSKFAPVECDACLTRRTPENFWFYNETNQGYIRTVDELVGMYYMTVGRGCNLLLNIAPNRRGLLPDYAVHRIQAMHRELTYRFRDCRIPCGPVTVCDEPDGKKRFTVSLDAYRLIDHVVIRENLQEGEQVRNFTVYILPFENNNPTHEGRIDLFMGQSIGRKRICTFPTIRAKLVDILVDAGQISSIEVFYVGDRSGNQIMG